VLALASFALAGIASLLPVAGWAWLTSAAGGELLRGQLLEAANASLSGRLEVDSLRLGGLLSVRLEGVRLTAPGDAAPVLEAAAAETDVRLLALLGRRLEIGALLLDRPRVRLATGADGTTNLARALASRESPGPGSPEKRPVDLAIHVGQVQVRGGRVEVDGATPMDVEALTLDAAVSGRVRAFTAELAGSASVRAPVAREVAFAWRGGYESEGLISSKLLEFSFGGSRLKARGEVRAAGLDAGALELDELVVAAVDVNGLPEAWRGSRRLLGDVRATGRATLDGNHLTAKVDAALPAGSLALEADATVGLPDAEGNALTWSAKVGATDVEPHRIVAGLDAAKVNLVARAEGAGLWPTGRATLVADASGSRWGQLEVPKATATATFAGQVVELQEASVQAAGASARARGTVGMRQGKLRVELAVPDLARTRTLLQQGLGLDLPELRGGFSVEADLSGPWTAPAIRARVSAPRVAVGSAEVVGITGKIGLQAWRPELHASADLSLERLEAGGIKGGRLSLAAKVDGRVVAADVDGVLGGTPVLARVRGVREPRPRPGVERWRIETLGGRALGVAMSSERAMAVEFAGGRVTVDGLALAGDLGRVDLRGSGGATGPLDVQLTVSELKVQVPKSLLPANTRLEGTIAANAQVTGTLAAPRVLAQINVVEGRFDALAPVSAYVELGYEAGRLATRASAAFPGGGELSLTGKVPLRAFEDSSQPIEAEASFGSLDVALLAQFAPSLAGAEGQLSGEVSVRGSLGAPDAKLRILLEKGQAGALDAMTGLVQATYEDGVLAAKAYASRPRTLGLELDVTAPLKLQEWLAASRPDWRAVPVKAALTVEHLDLAWLERLGAGVDGLSGALAGTVLVKGSAQAPTGSGTLRLTGAAYEGVTALEASVALEAGQAVTLDVETTVGKKPFVSGRLRAAAGLGTLAWDGKTQVAKVPLEGELRLAPTPLPVLREALGTASASALAVDGVVAGTVRLDGTLDAPDLSLDADIPKVRLAGVEVGQFALNASYANGRATGLARFTSSKDGSLSASLLAPGELGLEALRKERADRAERGLPSTVGAVLMDRKVSATVKARRFDLALANGFSETVTDLAGLIDADVRLAGTPNAPELSGSMKMDGGRMAIESFGAFQNLAMDAELEATELRVTKLAGAGRTGTFEGSALVTLIDGFRRAKGTMQLRTTDLPIVQNFQTRATLTMASTTQFRIENKTVLAETTLSSGLLRIPERLPRRVQVLDAHSDFVVAGQGRRPRSRDEDVPGMRYEVTLVMPDNFKIEAPQGTDLWIGTRLGITVNDRVDPRTGSSVSIGGPDRDTIRLTRGTVNLLGRRFELERKSRIQFVSPDWADPDLSIQARYTGKDGTTVDVDIAGSAQAPKPTFTATPTMDEAEIFFYLTTGKKQARAMTQGSSLGESLADTGLSVAGSAVAGVLKSAIARLVPVSLDVLSIETDVAKGAGRVRAGKYVTDRLYVGGQVNQSLNPQPGENMFEGEVEYQFDESKSFYFKGGEQGRFGAELLLRMNIPTRDQEQAAQGKK
jgi:translocation and assembly module TamB